ncbi:MAG: hypothetical protein AAB091_03375, partial [Elusimicrobiota bacterium]
DEQWMIRVALEGWTAETPQGSDILFLSGYFEGQVLNITVSRPAAGQISADEQMEQWKKSLGPKTKAPVVMEFGPGQNLLYILSQDKTELFGLLDFNDARYPVNIYGYPNIDFQETKRVFSTIEPIDAAQVKASSPAPGAPGADELPPAPSAIGTIAAIPKENLPRLPAPDPRIKMILDKYFPLASTTAALVVLGYIFFLWLNDKKLLQNGRAFASKPEVGQLELFTGGWYLTLFPTVIVFAPGGVRLAAVRRRPPMAQALGLIFLARWVAVYFGLEKALAVLSVALIIAAIVFAVAIGWSFKGTPCWIYDEQGLLVFKIRRQLGLFAYRFIVTAPTKNEVLGYLKMSSLSNFIRKQWWILNKKGETVGQMTEDSLIKSIARRFIGHLWGLFRANFTISSQGQTIGQIKSARSPFNRQTLSASCPAELDPRLVFACAISINVFNRDRWYPFWSA